MGRVWGQQDERAVVSTSPVTDEDLVAHAQAGDMEAFNQLVARWERPIYALAYRTLGREEDARDVAQEAFLRAYRGLKGFKGQAKFSSWLYRITLNLCRDWMRKARRAPLIQVPETEDGMDMAEQMPSPAESVEELVNRRQMSAAVAKAMLERDTYPDFIVVDGSEGGTGAAPLEFSDHIGTPLQEGLRLVHNTLVGLNLRDQIRLGASGKIVSAFDMAPVMAMGADWCNSARGFMFAIGCIQSQTCHTGNCPTGVTTQDAQRQMALVVPNKALRVKNFHHQTLVSLKELLEAAGLSSPDQLQDHHVFQRISKTEIQTLAQMYPPLAPGALLKESLAKCPEPFKTYWPKAHAERFSLK